MRALATGALALGLLLPAAIPAGAAPADSGPALTASAAKLRDSLECSGLERGRPTVLLIHGTALTPETSFDWNYEPAFAATDRPYCTLALPERGMGDIQIAAEYVVHAIRTMAARTGEAVSIIGHSQGGMIGRWALKFWPDTRAKVSDLVGLAPSNSGTLLADAICTPTCAPAIWQQRLGSTYLNALNEGRETYAGVDYTVVYTFTDGVIIPAEGTRLSTGSGRIANIPLSKVCPVRYADHLSVGTYDAVAYALAIDALDHRGPADAGRIDPSTCFEVYAPGVDPRTAPADYAAVVSEVAETIAETPGVRAEPPLRDYAR